MTIKDELIKILEENRNEILSGQELANQLQVSRTAIWKAIKVLKNDGYIIDATTNQGYCLQENTDILSRQGIMQYLNNDYQDATIFVYKEVDSTNTEMKRLLLNNAKDKTIVISDKQTSGRGRFNRVFYSPCKTGIYFSLLLKKQEELQDATSVTIQSAVAVTRAIKKLAGIKLNIKWVNDIYYQGKKTGGILTEASSDFESGTLDSIIVGIGLNVFTLDKDFPNDIKDIATTLDIKNCTRNQIIAEILNQFFIIRTEPKEQIIQEYKNKSCILNRIITYKKGNYTLSAKVIDINNDGYLVVENNYQQVVLTAGEITIGELKDATK